MSQYVQREGTVKFGTSAGTLVNVGADVFKCRIVRTFDSVARKGTFADSRNTEYPGNYQDELQVEFYSIGGTAGTTLDGIISEAVFGATPSTVLYFEFSQFTGSTSAANQKFTGSISVLEAAKGGTIGELRAESMTFPVLTINRASA